MAEGAHLGRYQCVEHIHTHHLLLNLLIGSCLEHIDLLGVDGVEYTSGRDSVCRLEQICKIGLQAGELAEFVVDSAFDLFDAVCHFYHSFDQRILFNLVKLGILSLGLRRGVA